MKHLSRTHDRFDSTSDPSFNGHLHYPNDLDGTLNEDTVDKIRQYHSDYNNRDSNTVTISFMPAIKDAQIHYVNTNSLCQHSEFVSIVNFKSFGYHSTIDKTTLLSINY